MIFDSKSDMSEELIAILKINTITYYCKFIESFLIELTHYDCFR